jgi:hypothetical protein
MERVYRSLATDSAQVSAATILDFYPSNHMKWFSLFSISFMTAGTKPFLVQLMN